MSSDNALTGLECSEGASNEGVISEDINSPGFVDDGNVSMGVDSSDINSEDVTSELNSDEIRRGDAIFEKLRQIGLCQTGNDRVDAESVANEPIQIPTTGIVEEWTNEGMDDAAMEVDPAGICGDLIGNGEGQWGEDMVRGAVEKLGYLNYPAALYALKGKPAVPLEGTPFFFKYDEAVRAFFVCDRQLNLLMMLCPVQPCTTEMEGPVGCPTHNDKPRVLKTLPLPSVIYLSEFTSQKMFSDGIVVPEDIQKVKCCMAVERRTGTDELALLKSVGNRQYFSKELGLTVRRFDHHSKSFLISCFGSKHEFATCAGQGCHRVGRLVVWNESFCSVACRDERMTPIPKDDSNRVFGRKIDPVTMIVQAFKTAMKDDQTNHGVDEKEAVKRMYSSVYGAGDCGLEVWHGRYKFSVKMAKSDYAVTLKWYGNIRNPERHCNNLLCLKSIVALNKNSTKMLLRCMDCQGAKFNARRYLKGVSYGSNCDKDV